MATDDDGDNDNEDHDDDIYDDNDGDVDDGDDNGGGKDYHECEGYGDCCDRRGAGGRDGYNMRLG